MLYSYFIYYFLFIYIFCRWKHYYFAAYGTLHYTPIKILFFFLCFRFPQCQGTQKVDRELQPDCIKRGCFIMFMDRHCCRGRPIQLDFHLTAPVLNASVSWLHSQQILQNLFISDIVILDSILMVPKDQLRVTGPLLRDIMNNNLHFGSPIFLYVGDFR